jgi:hypothetical protein
VKKYESIVSESILESFLQIKGNTLMNHVSNSYDIEMAIGFASLFCPEVVEDDGCIFIAEFYNGDMEGLKRHYKTRKEIEMFVNSWSLQEMLADNDQLNYDIDYIGEFAKAIQYFWQLRMDTLFPNRNVVVEIGETILGENGLSVTVYQQ